eukprot:3773638-Pleurochrysis_carterae.AAC.3
MAMKQKGRDKRQFVCKSCCYVHFGGPAWKRTRESSLRNVIEAHLASMSRSLAPAPDRCSKAGSQRAAQT